jgi:hypothetical protein
MIVQFDVKSMNVQILCGVLEEYTPSDEIKDIYSKVETLKAEMNEFTSKVMNPKLKEINELVENHNKKYIVKDAQ